MLLLVSFLQLNYTVRPVITSILCSASFNGNSTMCRCPTLIDLKHTAMLPLNVKNLQPVFCFIGNSQTAFFCLDNPQVIRICFCCVCFVILAKKRRVNHVVKKRLSCGYFHTRSPKQKMAKCIISFTPDKAALTRPTRTTPSQLSTFVCCVMSPCCPVYEG